MFRSFADADPPTASPSTELQRSNGIYKRDEDAGEDQDFFAVAEGDEGGCHYVRSYLVLSADRSSARVRRRVAMEC